MYYIHMYFLYMHKYVYIYVFILNICIYKVKPVQITTSVRQPLALDDQY